MKDIVLTNENLFIETNYDSVKSIHLNNIDINSEIYTIIYRCNNLEELAIKNSKINNCLYDFTKIKYLYLESCTLEDLSLINSCIKVENLYLIDCGTIDIKLIQVVKSIKTLSLELCNVENIEYLITIDNLEQLDICFTNIDDISSFIELPKLNTLMLDTRIFENNYKLLKECNIDILNEDGDPYE